jgi:hypothetical protein
MSGNNLIINNNDRKRRITTPLIALLIAVVISIAFASVFVYYPMAVTLQPVQPPVYFETGSNAGAYDLGGSGTPYTSNTIYVSIGSNATSLNITVHPTYQVTYYKNVSIVYNNDGKSYKVCFRVNTPLSNLPSGSKAYLYIYSQGGTRSLSGYPTPTPSGYLAQIDLTSTGTTCVETTTFLGYNQFYEMDLYIYIPEGYNVGMTSGTTYTANLLLIYTPQTSETPP